MGRPLCLPNMLRSSGVRSSEFGVRSSEFGVRSSEFVPSSRNLGFFFVISGSPGLSGGTFLSFFSCNGDLPMTFAARPRFARWSLASLGGTASLRSAEQSLRSAEPRFARAAEPRFARLEASENGTPSGEPSGGLHSPAPERRNSRGSTRRKNQSALLSIFIVYTVAFYRHLLEYHQTFRQHV